MENFCKIGKLESRTLKKLSPVLRNPAGCENSDNIVYDVCRGDKQKEHLRYDITVIHPERINGEFPKTFGHYHSDNAPELFEVIEGKSFLMLQKNEKPEIVSKVYLIEINPGEKGVVIPNHGFTNINPEKNKSLVISNWIDDRIKNKYDIIKDFHGLCYYAVEDNTGNVVFEKNPKYKEVPEIVRLQPKKFPTELENLDFLTYPEKYADLLTIDSLYKKI